MYDLNNIALEYRKQKLTKLQGGIDKSTVESFNTHLWVIDIRSQQKIKISINTKDWTQSTKLINAYIYIYMTCIFYIYNNALNNFSSSHGEFTEVGHFLDQYFLTIKQLS